MSTEVVANLWTFVKNGFAYEVGVRLYMVSGNDDEKLALLYALAPFDFHFAHRFPIPIDYKVTIVDGGRSKEFSGLLQPIPDQYLDCFRDVWDPLKQTIPEHKIGTSGAVSTRAPLQTSNLLSINTYIQADASGSQVAQIPNPQFSGQQPKLLLNRWAFADAGLSHVFAVAGRAYMAVGNDTQLARIFSTLAPDDYFLSRRIPISSSSATVKASDVLSEQSLFDEVLRDIQESIPLGRLDWITERTAKFSFHPEEARVKTSVVIENQEGKVSVSDAAPTRAETVAASSRVPSPSSATPAPTKLEAIIVFGPEYSGYAKSIQDTVRKEGGFDGKIFCVRDASSLSFETDELSRCSMAFCHFVPGRRGTSSSHDVIENWQSRFLKELHLTPGLNEADCKHPKKSWSWAYSQSVGGLTFSWDRVDAEVCRRIARAMESIFHRLSKPWWKFWS